MRAFRPFFFIFQINNIILRCIVCIPLALNFSLARYLCGFVENEEVKYFAIIRWQTGPLLDVRVCVL
jgi:hypothetical protein